MSGAEAAIIGAVVGAGTSAATGGDPLKGALIGGATGGLGGGGFFGGAKGAAAGATGGAASVPASAAANSAATQAGLVFNPATGSLLNPEYFALANTANPIYTGAGGLGSQISTGLGSLLDTPTMQGLAEYAPSPQAIGNLGLNLGSQSLMRPPVQAPAGGITQGKPLDITAVENLLKGRQQAPSGLISDYFG